MSHLACALDTTPPRFDTWVFDSIPFQFPRISSFDSFVSSSIPNHLSKSAHSDQYGSSLLHIVAGHINLFALAAFHLESTHSICVPIIARRRYSYSIAFVITAIVSPYRLPPSCFDHIHTNRILITSSQACTWLSDSEPVISISLEVNAFRFFSISFGFKLSRCYAPPIKSSRLESGSSPLDLVSLLCFSVSMPFDCPQAARFRLFHSFSNQSHLSWCPRLYSISASLEYARVHSIPDRIISSMLK